MTVIVHSDSFDVPLRVGPDIFDITGHLGRIVAEAGVRHGSAHVAAIGSTGSRIIATLINALRVTGGKRGIASLCIGGGEATAVAVELLD